MYQRFRRAVHWKERNRPVLRRQHVIVDITRGPNRRASKASAPSRPLYMEAMPFMVACAYVMDGESRRFIPGILLFCLFYVHCTRTLRDLHPIMHACK